MTGRALPLFLCILLATGSGCAGLPPLATDAATFPSPTEAERAQAYYEEGVTSLETAKLTNRRLAPTAFEKASEALQACLRLDPGNLDAQVKLVEALDGLDREKDLLRRLRAVLAVDSLQVEANEQLACRTYGVALAFVTVGVLGPRHNGQVMTKNQRKVLRSQGVRYKDLEDLLLEARAVCERLLRIAPEDPRYLCALGAVKNLQGDYSGAVEAYTLVRKIDPDLLVGNGFHNTVFVVSRENRIFVSGSPRSFLRDLGGREFRLIR